MASIAAALDTQNLQSKPWLKWAIAITASLGALLEIVDVSIVNVALADMQSSLGATLAEIGWVVTSYAIANVVIIPLSAWLGDYFGKKRYFVFSLIAFTVASMLCGFATTLPQLVGARVLQGIFGGGLLAKSQSILYETFPRHEQGKAQAIFGIGVIVGPTIGPTLGGYLTTNFNWRWIFFINLPVGILAILMAMAFLPTDPIKRLISAKVDWLGIGLLVAGLGGLQWVLEEGQSEDWFSSRAVVVMSVVAVVGMILFVWRELSVGHPAVDLRVLRHRSLAAGSLFSTILGLSLYGALFAIPIYAQVVLRYTAVDTGLMLMPGALAAGFMMPFLGKMVGRIDPRLIVAAGASIVIGTMFALANMNPNTSQDSLFWPLLWRGIGTASMFLPLTLATLGPVPREDIPAATGFFNLTRQMGGSIGVAILTTMLARREAFHRSVLVEHISAFNPIAQQRLSDLTAFFVSKGADLQTARDRALKVVDRGVDLQSMILSFEDVFKFVAVVMIVSLPLIFYLGKPQRAAAPPEAH